MTKYCEFRAYVDAVVVLINNACDTAMKDFIHILSNLQLSDGWLTAIIGFETAVIAFLIPLSIEIVSKLSERYSSDVITREYENHWLNFWFRFVLLIIIAISVLLLVFENHSDQSIWRFCGLIVIFLFLWSIWATWVTVSRMKLFMSNIDQVVEELAEEAERSIE